MKIKTVHYLVTVNLGNYSNEKIGFSAELEDSESPESAIEALRQKALDCALPNTTEIYREIENRRRALASLNLKLDKAKQQWELTAEFLRKQGIKPDAVDMPQFTNLLPQVEDEHSEVAEGEIEDEDRIF